MAAFLVLTAMLSFYVPPVVTPATYRSASGDFALNVDPSESEGSGPGRYRLTRDGEVIWERQHPFTLFEAAVANDSMVAGVSYSRGLEGGGFGEGQGDLRLVVLTPSGDVRFEHVMPRRWSRVIHGLPVPQSKGVLIDEVNDRLLLRILPDETRGEEWWWYEVSTGELLQSLDPKSGDSKCREMPNLFR